MKALIIEDEKSSADALASLLVRSYHESEVIGIVSSVKEGISFLSNSCSKPDIIFSDIHLSDGVCFSIFDNVNVDAAIVFTTAFDNYALKAFKYYSAAYLLKPIMEKDLLPAIEKALKMRGVQDLKSIQETDINLSGKNPHQLKKLMLINGDNYYLTKVVDICAIVVDGRHVKVYSTSGNYGYDTHNLRFFEENLDMTRFEKVNRQTIIAIDKIIGGERISETSMRLLFKTNIPEKIIVSYDQFMKIVKTQGR